MSKIYDNSFDNVYWISTSKFRTFEFRLQYVVEVQRLCPGIVNPESAFTLSIRKYSLLKRWCLQWLNIYRRFKIKIWISRKPIRSTSIQLLRCRTGCHKMSNISTAHLLVIFIISSPLLIDFVSTNPLQLMVFLTTVTQILLTFLAPSSHAQCEFSMTKLKVSGYHRWFQ